MKNPTLLSDIQDNNNYSDDGDEDENESDQGPEHKRYMWHGLFDWLLNGTC